MVTVYSTNFKANTKPSVPLPEPFEPKERASKQDSW